MLATSLPRHDVVLLGAGHTHAHIVRMVGMHPLPDTRVTCISNFHYATYSGMLPGVLARQYTPDEMSIDLVRLCTAAGVRLVVDEVIAVDRTSREIQFADRAPIRYDWLSVGIGSRPALSEVEFSGDSCLSIKPMQTFLERLVRRCGQLRERGLDRVRVVIVGAGAGGVEIAFCLPAFLQTELPRATCEISLIQAHPQILGEAWRGTQQRVAREMERRGLRFRPNRRVTRVDEQEVWLDDGSREPADIVLWSTSAVAPPLLGKLGLSTDSRGFLLTHTTLQSVDDDRLFAVGDAGTIAETPTAKAGVYAVRQGPVLWENLERSVRGEAVVAYRPQTDFLKLINLGDGRAVGEWRGWSFSGRWVWRWKNSIDSRFMRMYRDFAPSRQRMPDRSAPTTTIERPIRCAGCGGKIGGTVLARVLQRLVVGSRPEIELGLGEADDAAVLQLPTPGRIALTTDFFAAPWDDPFLLGRVAALHAASDCFVMGATPIAALALAAIPTGPAHQQEQVLFEMLSGACREFRHMGATLAGGHTLENDSLLLGFTMVAGQAAAPITKGGLRPGDALVLARPLGTGVLLAAQMQARCSARWWSSLVAHLLTTNQAVTEVAIRHGTRGMTDITGFGLAGHLGEMLRASRVGAELHLGTIPLLPGVRELLDEGWESTLAPANRELNTVGPVDNSLATRAEYRALFDPQTQGGVLIGLPEAAASRVLQDLAGLGIEAARIGEVLPLGDDGPVARVRP